MFFNIEENVKKLSKITIASLADSDFNYTFEFDHSTSNFSFIINLILSKALVNSPLLCYELNLSDYFLYQNNLLMPSKFATIKLMEYYPLSEKEKQLASSVNNQVGTNQNIAQGSGYASILFSSGSSLFANGLMLVEMLFLLKFININYPQIVIDMFEQNSHNPKILLQTNFINKPSDLEVLPEIFQRYNVSVYFLNNVGEELCQLFLLTLIGVFFLYITPYEKSTEKKTGIGMKILILIKDALVWELTLFYVFMNLQKIIFMVFCTWMFTTTNSYQGIFNLSISTCIALFIIIWIIHLFMKIKLCHKFKEALLINNNDLIQSNSLEVSSFNAKTNRITPINSILESSNDYQSPGFLTSPKDIEKKSSSPKILTKINIGPSDHENNKTYKSLSTTNPPSSNSEVNEIELQSKPKNKFIEKIKKLLSFYSIKKYLFQPKNTNVYLLRYELLHLDYKSKKNFHIHYLLIYCLRQCCLSILTVILFKYPLTQIIFINLINSPFSHESSQFFLLLISKKILKIILDSVFEITLNILKILLYMNNTS